MITTINEFKQSLNENSSRTTFNIGDKLYYAIFPNALRQYEVTNTYIKGSDEIMDLKSTSLVDPITISIWKALDDEEWYNEHGNVVRVSRNPPKTKERRKKPGPYMGYD